MTMNKGGKRKPGSLSGLVERKSYKGSKLQIKYTAPLSHTRSRHPQTVYMVNTTLHLIYA